MQAPTAPPGPPGLDTLPQPLLHLKSRAEGVEDGPEATFYILGTAHVSPESCNDVAKLIAAVRPQVRQPLAAGGRRRRRLRCLTLVACLPQAP